MALCKAKNETPNLIPGRWKAQVSSQLQSPVIAQTTFRQPLGFQVANSLESGEQLQRLSEEPSRGEKNTYKYGWVPPSAFTYPKALEFSNSTRLKFSPSSPILQLPKPLTLSNSFSLLYSSSSSYFLIFAYNSTLSKWIWKYLCMRWIIVMTQQMKSKLMQPKPIPRLARRARQRGNNLSFVSILIASSTR